MVMGEHYRKNMRDSFMLAVLLLVPCTAGEDPYRFHTWNVTYGDIYPLGVKQQVRWPTLFSISLFLIFEDVDYMGS